MRPDRRDAVAFGGLVVACVGGAVMHPAAAVLVLGLAIFSIGVWVMK